MKLTKNNDETLNLENLTEEEINSIYNWVSLGADSSDKNFIKELEKQVAKLQ